MSKSETKFLKIFCAHVPTSWRHVKNICPSSAKSICYFSVCHWVFSQGSAHNNRGAPPVWRPPPPPPRSGSFTTRRHLLQPEDTFYNRTTFTTSNESSFHWNLVLFLRVANRLHIHCHAEFQKCWLQKARKLANALLLKKTITLLKSIFLGVRISWITRAGWRFQVLFGGRGF